MRNGEAVRRLDERITSIEKIAQATEERTADILRGFPQEYLTRDDAQRQADQLEKAIDGLRDNLSRVGSDHVSRDSFDTLRDTVRQSSGARTTIVAVAGIIVTVFIFMLGYVITHQLTNADVSNQIQREAPWNRDQPEIRRRINSLETQVQMLNGRIRALETKLDGHIAASRG